MGFWKEKIFFLPICERYNVVCQSFCPSYNLASMQFRNIAILTSRNQAINISRKQYFNTSLKKLIGRGTPSGKGRDHPSRRAKNTFNWVIFLSLETRLRSGFLKEFRAAEIILSSSEHTLLLSDDNQFQSPEIHLAISNFRTNNSISLLTFTSVILA